MQPPPSLTLRLTLLFNLTSAIVFSTFGWITERSLMMHFQNEDKIELKLISRTVSQALSEWTDTKDKGALEQRFNDILLGHHGAVLYVCDVNGKALFASPGGPNLSDVTMDNAFHDKVYDWSDTKHTYRI